MKSLALSLLLCAAAASAAAAQTRVAQPAAGRSFQMGDREVSIPAPEGFVEVASRSEQVKKFFEATEATGLDLLAVHVPADTAEKIFRGEHPTLEFYTKVSVSKDLRAADSSREFFSQIVATLRANNGEAFNFDTPEMRAQLQQQNKGLSEALKQDSKIDMSRPVNLGEIDHTPDSYGVLLLSKVKVQSGPAQVERMMLAGASAVWVRNRIVWIYTYKIFHSGEDVDALRDFTKRWLADILRANA